MWRWYISSGAALLTLAILGCDTATQPPASSTGGSSNSKPATGGGLTAGMQATGVALPDQLAPAPAASPAAPAQAPAASAPQGQKAQVGVGKQGSSLANERGVGKMIAQPVVTLFRFREKAVFEIQIPSAIKLFEASEGRKIKSHQEFMDKIISANQIRLPELPAGSEYNYHTDSGELWVHPIEPKL